MAGSVFINGIEKELIKISALDTTKVSEDLSNLSDKIGKNNIILGQVFNAGDLVEKTGNKGKLWELNQSILQLSLDFPIYRGELKVNSGKTYMAESDILDWTGTETTNGSIVLGHPSKVRVDISGTITSDDSKVGFRSFGGFSEFAITTGTSLGQVCQDLVTSIQGTGDFNSWNKLTYTPGNTFFELEAKKVGNNISLPEVISNDSGVTITITPISIGSKKLSILSGNTWREATIEEVTEKLRELGIEEIESICLNETSLVKDATELGYTFMGIADPETNPKTFKGRGYYIPSISGTYSGFLDIQGNPIVVYSAEKPVLLTENGTIWKKEDGFIANKKSFQRQFGNWIYNNIGLYINTDNNNGACYDSDDNPGTKVSRLYVTWAGYAYQPGLEVSWSTSFGNLTSHRGNTGNKHKGNYYEITTAGETYYLVYSPNLTYGNTDNGYDLAVSTNENNCYMALIEKSRYSYKETDVIIGRLLVSMTSSNTVTANFSSNVLHGYSKNGVLIENGKPVDSNINFPINEDELSQGMIVTSSSLSNVGEITDSSSVNYNKYISTTNYYPIHGGANIPIRVKHKITIDDVNYYCRVVIVLYDKNKKYLRSTVSSNFNIVPERWEIGGDGFVHINLSSQYSTNPAFFRLSISYRLPGSTTEANIIPEMFEDGDFAISIPDYRSYVDSKLEGFNSYSTDKLSVPRKIFGQSFDGTQDVKGNMSGVGSLSMNGVLSGARGEIKGVSQLYRYNYIAGSTATMTGANSVVIASGEVWTRFWLMDRYCIAGHTYFVHVNVNLQSSIAYMLSIVTDNGASSSITNNLTTNNSKSVDWIAIYNPNDNTDRRLMLRTNGQAMTISDISVFDLTQMFGEGNEPTTATEFANRLGYASIDDVPYIPYTEEPIELNNALSIGSDVMSTGFVIPGKTSNDVLLGDGTTTSISDLVSVALGEIAETEEDLDDVFTDD